MAISPQDLESLVNITNQYFLDHDLKISIKKSKAFLSTDGDGELHFVGETPDSCLKIGIVSSFKYLGVKLNSRPYKLFSDFNANVVQKCESFLHSILSLTQSNFDKSFMALTLWRNVALPAILYGVECIPLTQSTIEKIELTQNKIGKYALQVSSSSANIQVAVDAGLIPIRFVICQKVLQYVEKLKNKPRNNFASICYSESTSKCTKFSKYVETQVLMLTTAPHFPANIPQAVKITVKDFIKRELSKFSSCFVISTPDLVDIGKTKSWVSDSPDSESYAKFRCMNVRLGNRFPTLTGFSSHFCPFCLERGANVLNNEIHLVIECPYFSPIRSKSLLSDIISTMESVHDSAYIYKYLLDDRNPLTRDICKGLLLIQDKWKSDIDALTSP